MTIDEYLSRLPALTSQGRADDRAARLAGKPRTHVATRRQRLTSRRNVERAERIIGKRLDYPKARWPLVLRTLARYDERAWRSLDASRLPALRKPKKRPTTSKEG